MRASRLVIVGCSVAMTVALVATPVAAFDVSDYLAEADDAVYSGRRVVVTVWDGESRSGVVDVEHAGGMMMVGEESMVGDGTVRRLDSGSEGVAVTRWSAVAAAPGYDVVTGDPTEHLGRAATTMQVMEGDLLRAELVIDDDTAAPLVTEIFDDEGRLYRYSSMVEFTPSMKNMPVPPRTTGEYEVMLRVAGSSMPVALGGYQRIDVYGGPGDSQQGFYSDGLFSYSLFVVNGERSVADMPKGASYRHDGAEYRAIITPAEAWLVWEAEGSTYVLVGDLPPDHLESVLEDLPRPSKRNIFARFWHALFG